MTATSIEFFVPGVPVGQGSKTFVPTARGPRARESNEQKLKPWRSSIVSAAPDLEQPLAGPVLCVAEFVFPRPKSHFGTGRNAALLKTHAPRFHVSKPDADKLIRALGDALAGVVIGDDSQIALWKVVKHYGSRPGVRIRIESLLMEGESS